MSAALRILHTFPTPGTSAYSCVHHVAIGLVGVVVVID